MHLLQIGPVVLGAHILAEVPLGILDGDLVNGEG